MLIRDGDKASVKIVKRSCVRKAKREALSDYGVPKFTDRLNGVETTKEQVIVKGHLETWATKHKDISNTGIAIEKAVNKYLPIKL